MYGNGGREDRITEKDGGFCPKHYPRTIGDTRLDEPSEVAPW